MSTPRPPSSPSDQPKPGHGGAGDFDDDLNLDEYVERPQQSQRQRLPEQRRESPSFEAAPPREETGAVPGFVPDIFESNPPAPAPGPVKQNLPGAGGWEPATPDEIASYDISAVETTPVERPPVSEALLPAPAPAPVKKKPEQDNDLEEFITRTALPPAPSDKPAKIRRPFKLVEVACLSVGAVILLTFAVWLGRTVVAAADSGANKSHPWPKLPMKGSLITITSAKGDWRPAVKDSDRLEQIEVILPIPGHFEPGIIPEVTVSIDPSASTSGYLRFIVRDNEGRARGDTRVIQVANGKFTSPVPGETIVSDTEASVYISSGLYDYVAYRAYACSDEIRWSVEIAESDSYNSGDKDWKILGKFDVRDELRR